MNSEVGMGKSEVGRGKLECGSRNAEEGKRKVRRWEKESVDCGFRIKNGIAALYLFN
jgi:hypothetical protein